MEFDCVSRPDIGTGSYEIQLFDLDTKVGQATLSTTMIDGLTILYVDYIESFERKKGYGSALVEKINSQIIDNNAIGFLVDGINPNNPAKGFYQRHGWIPRDNNEDDPYMFYNHNDDLNQSNLASKIINFVENDLYDLPTSSE